MMILATAIFFVLAAYFFFLGLRGLLKKKPFLYSAKSSFWIILVAFTPGMIFPLQSFWRIYNLRAERGMPFEWDNALILLIPLVMCPALIIFYWQMLRGYTVVGVTDESFRQALHSVLSDLKIPFEERLSKMHLTTLNADLEANVIGRMGTASLRIKQREHQTTLDQIARAMSDYFAGSHLAINMFTCIYYVIFGTLMFLTACVFTYVFVIGDSFEF